MQSITTHNHKNARFCAFVTIIIILGPVVEKPSNNNPRLKTSEISLILLNNTIVCWEN